MSFKFEIKEKDKLLITDTLVVDVTDSIVLDMPLSDAYYGFRELKNDKVFIYDKNSVNASSSGMITLDLSDCVDETLTSFTKDTFRDWASTKLGLDNSLEGLTNRIVVKKASDFGVIDSDKEYFLDGIIDMGGVSIEVPSGGIYISGYNFNLSGLTDSTAGYTLFTSPVGGSGDVLFMDFLVDINGVGSQVYDLVSDTGFNAVEVARINWNNCTSLGMIDNYRQGLETGTGRFGGTPELTLTGVWVGGYFIDVSIVRSLTDGAYSLFKAGVGFLMSSRFRSNQNIDLPANASFFDFAPSNFVNPSTVDMTEVLLSRNGVFNATDSNITPNMSEGDLVAKWSNNNGIPNTFEGGSIGVLGEVATVVSVIGDFYPVLATWDALDLQHFDNPSGGQLRHLGNTPREYKVVLDFTADSTANNELVLRVKKWDNSASSFITVLDQIRQVNNLAGGRDVAFFNININTELDKNDYIFIEVANNSSTSNVTVEVHSYFIVEQR